MTMIRVRRGLVHCSWFEGSRICTQSRDFVLNNKCECWVFKNRRRFFSFSECWKTRNCARSFLVLKVGHCSILRWLLLSFANVTKAGVPLITKDTVVRWSYLWQFKEPSRFLNAVSGEHFHQSCGGHPLLVHPLSHVSWGVGMALLLCAWTLGLLAIGKSVRWSVRSWKLESMQVQESVMQESFSLYTKFGKTQVSNLSPTQ